MEPMEMTKIILRKNLKELRDLKGWNQEELGEATGYTRGFIADIERGKSWVSPEALEKLAGALNVPIERLFLAEAKPKSKPFAETLPVPRLIELLTKKTSSVPARVYELADKVPANHPAWEDVIAALEVAIEEDANHG